MVEPFSSIAEPMDKLCQRVLWVRLSNFAQQRFFLFLTWEVASVETPCKRGIVEIKSKEMIYRMLTY